MPSARPSTEKWPPGRIDYWEARRPNGGWAYGVDYRPQVWGVGWRFERNPDGTMSGTFIRRHIA